MGQGFQPEQAAFDTCSNLGSILQPSTSVLEAINFVRDCSWDEYEISDHANQGQLADRDPDFTVVISKFGRNLPSNFQVEHSIVTHHA
ncbi:uncharacterized protein LOC128196762 isoform X4 [Vigna angularis]|uniref:uncharacterized protein LOC128196762 isoform X4 n=1 Tax=Phaseolus angularis TaxID=3914 RepID=UPI0022B2ECAE|nr:uncharacterized protein LOC128196762 isoform X4 [Vigna angularis]